MPFFSKLFATGYPRDEAVVAEAICQDVSEAFERFTYRHTGEQINAFALCTVDDGSPPFITGATRESGFGPVGTAADKGWTADPPDWRWHDQGHAHSFDRAIDSFHTKHDVSSERNAQRLFQAMVNGLRQFDVSGRFKGRLPREEMLLLLWIQDPAHPKWVTQWAAELNPPPVADWFKAVSPIAEKPSAGH